MAFRDIGQLALNASQLRTNALQQQQARQDQINQLQKERHAQTIQAIRAEKARRKAEAEAERKQNAAIIGSVVTAGVLAGLPLLAAPAAGAVGTSGSAIPGILAAGTTAEGALGAAGIGAGLAAPTMPTASSLLGFLGAGGVQGFDYMMGRI